MERSRLSESHLSGLSFWCQQCGLCHIAVRLHLCICDMGPVTRSSGNRWQTRWPWEPGLLLKTRHLCLCSLSSALWWVGVMPSPSMLTPHDTGTMAGTLMVPTASGKLLQHCRCPCSAWLLHSYFQHLPEGKVGLPGNWSEAWHGGSCRGAKRHFWAPQGLMSSTPPWSILPGGWCLTPVPVVNLVTRSIYDGEVLERS